MSEDPRIGSRIGPYRIVSLLGRGGMGIVYLAEHIHLERPVALKVLAEQFAHDPTFRQRFIRESRMAARLRHPNIIPVYDAGEEGDSLFIAMQLVEGTDLGEMLEAGPLASERSLSILEKVASALDEAHANGIVHRDVKPANIMVGRPHTGHADEEVYLTDFGIVRDLTQHTRLTDTGTFVGTLDYAAPEVFQGVQIDGRADEYSLACVLYRCLTGDVPFPADSEAAVIAAHLMQPPPAPSSREPSMPPALDAVLQRALAKSPEERFDTCGEFIQRSREALGPAVSAPAAGEPPSSRGQTAWAAPPAPLVPAPLTPPVAAPPPPAPPGRSNKRGIAAIAAALAVVALVVVVVILAGGSSKHPSGAPSTPGASRSPAPTSPSAPTTSPPTTSSPSAPPTSGGATGSPVAPGPKPVVEKTVRVGSLPFGVARDAKSVWVANQGGGTVSRIDPRSRTVFATIKNVPNAFEVAAGLGSVWVTDQRKTLFRIDPSGGKPAAIQMQGGAFGVTVGFGSVWVTNDKSDTVTRLDASGKVLARIGVGHVPHGITAGTDSIWVANDSGTVTRIDPTTNSKSAQINLNDSAFQLEEASGSVWVTNGFSAVHKIDPGTNKAVATIEARGGAFDVVGGFGSVWVTESGSNTVIRIDPAKDTITATVDVGVSPRYIAVGPEGLWVANGDSQSVSLVHP